MPNPGTISLPLGVSTFTSGGAGLSSIDVETCNFSVVVVADGLVVIDSCKKVVPRLISRTGSITCVIVVFDMLCEITLFGFTGLIGLIGLAGLLIFVVVILQVSNIVDQAVHVGEPYGSEHREALCSCK